MQGEPAISRPGKKGRRRTKLRNEDMQCTTSKRAICDDCSLHDEFLKEGTITTFKMVELCNIFIKDVGTVENKKDDFRRICHLNPTDKADDGAELGRACTNITNN
eukprot:13974643-Ditylum_brightwellii.AAC.1